MILTNFQEKHFSVLWTDVDKKKSQIWQQTNEELSHHIWNNEISVQKFKLN